MKTLKVLFIMILLSSLSSGTVKADFIFSEPNMVPNINSDSSDSCPQISRDGLELYFSSNRDGIYENIWVSKRLTITDPWSEPVKLDNPPNSTGTIVSPSLSADGLELYFERENDLWVSTRVSKADPWGHPSKFGPPVNTQNRESNPCISADGLELYFMSDRPGGFSNPSNTDIFVATREYKKGQWGEPVKLDNNVNSVYYESTPFISSSGLLLFFGRGERRGHVYVCRRTTTKEPWGPAEIFAPIRSEGSEFFVSLLDRDPKIYFAHGTDVLSNDWNIWQVEATPIVDLNNDLKVDSADMHIMVDHWGENYPLCDIAPVPMGDGIVDVQDFIVLDEHLYRLTAHWKLDEIDGNIAYDSAGDYDGILNGNPSWFPTHGKTDGSMMLDGIDDYVDTPFVLDPGKEAFSVLAWIKCWTPGQVILSQKGEFGETWLGIDPSGKLMTGFGDVNFGALVPESIITDIQWHHVGFVYDTDTFHRRLYVDGILVAEDIAIVPGILSDGGLRIGASKDLGAGTLFSGFIDDVRIYKQALPEKEIKALVQ